MKLCNREKFFKFQNWSQENVSVNKVLSTQTRGPEASQAHGWEGRQRRILELTGRPAEPSGKLHATEKPYLLVNQKRTALKTTKEDNV